MPEQVKVVCSTSGESAVKNKQKLGGGYDIEQPSDAVKRINFYTSTCFEGCDIYDPNGLTVIVSDGGAEHTLLDISTAFTQICGRVRNSKYLNVVYHVYSTTRYNTDISLAEFEKVTYDAFNDAKKYADIFNGMDESARLRTLDKIPSLGEPYIIKDGSRFIASRTFADLDVHRFRISHQIYRSHKNLSDELVANGYVISTYKYSCLAEKICANQSGRVKFRELFDEYVRLKIEKPILPQFSFDSNETICGRIATIQPLVREAYDKLGVDKVKELKYHIGNIKRELTKCAILEFDGNIVRLVDTTLPKCKPITKQRAKQKLQKIYNTLGLKRTAKASDLER